MFYVEHFKNITKNKNHLNSLRYSDNHCWCADVYPPGTMFSTDSKADRKGRPWGFSSDHDNRCIQSPKRTESSYTHKDVTEKWLCFQVPGMDIHIIQRPYGINTGWLERTERSTRNLSEMMEIFYLLFGEQITYCVHLSKPIQLYI